jgi:hypothetical protein
VTSAHPGAADHRNSLRFASAAVADAVGRPSLRTYPKEKAGCWTRRGAFAQVRQGPNIQLLPYPLVSGIEGSALCGAAFPHVAGERQARRDAFLTRRSKRCRQIRLRSSGAPGRPSGAPSWRHPDRPAGLTRSRIRSWAPPKTCTNCLRSPRRVGRCGQAGDGGVEDELVPGEFLEERGPP